MIKIRILRNQFDFWTINESSNCGNDHGKIRSVNFSQQKCSNYRKTLRFVEQLTYLVPKTRCDT